MEPFKHILLAVDTGSPDQNTVKRATRLAEDQGARLKLVDTVRELSWAVRRFTSEPDHIQKLLAQEKQQQLEAIAEPIRQRGIPVTTRLLSDYLSIAMIQEVLRDGHDLVMKVTKGPASRRTGFFGTTAMRLLRKSPCPVWLTNPDGPETDQRVMAAVDANPHDEAHGRLNGRILESANMLCRTEGCTLHVVSAWSIFGESLLKSHMKPKEFEELQRKTLQENRTHLQKLLADHQLQLAEDQVHLEHDDAVDVIPRLVEEADIDVIVMGTVARTGIPGLLMGNSAEKILGRVDCSVLAWKPEGFVSPVTLDESQTPAH